MQGMKLKLTVTTCLGVAITLSLFSAVSMAQDKAAASDLFKNNCASCHGDEGAGSALGKKLNSPDLRTQQIHHKATTELTQAITKGKGKMPAFEGQLTSDQISALVDYVRSLHASGGSSK